MAETSLQLSFSFPHHHQTKKMRKYFPVLNYFLPKFANWHLPLIFKFEIGLGEDQANYMFQIEIKENFNGVQ